MRSETAVHGRLTEATTIEGITGDRSHRSTPVLWAWLDLNQRPHPYQQSGAHRCADRRFPRSPLTVRGEVMRSCNPARINAPTSVVATGKVCQQPVAGKAMGLPVGAAAPSMADRVRRRARAEPCAWSAWQLARPARPPTPGRNQDTQRRNEPAGRPARLRGHWGRHLGGCCVGDGEALSGLHPLEGGVRGGLVLGDGPAVAPGLPDLPFSRWPWGGLLVRGMGVGDGGHAGRVHGRHHKPPEPGRVRAWTWLPPELVNQRRWALADNDGILWLVPATLTVAS
jgi:hypothetical protein